MKRIQLKHLSRIEGEASLEVLLDEKGRFRDLRLKSDLFRGFERFCVGRPVEEMPFLASRICGICAEAHYLASLKALDQIFDRPPPPEVRRIRRVFFLAGFLRDHLTVLSLFAAPDLVARSPSLEAFGGLKDLGLWEDFLEIRRALKEILELVSGRKLHGGGGVPGGWLKALGPEETTEIKRAVSRVHRGIKRFSDLWQGKLFRSLDSQNTSPSFGKKKAFLALSPDFVEGRLCGVLRKRRLSFEDYREAFTETVSGEETPTLTVFQGGHTYVVGPWARFVLWPSPKTPPLRDLHEMILGCLKQSENPSSGMLHFLRVYELVLAAERLKETVADLGPFRPVSDEVSVPARREGVGLVEAPRGLLVHHYEVDARGRLSRVRIFTPTAQNYRALLEDLKEFFEKAEKISEKVLKQAEKIVRAYDPCIPCMLHLLKLDNSRTS